jgi:hypothetical protein
MATVLEECNTKEQCSVERLLWLKGLNAKDIHKEMLLVYGGKCLSHKQVPNWVEKCGNHFADEELEMEVWKWLTQQSKDFYADGFVALVKRYDKCINVGGEYVQK